MKVTVYANWHEGEVISEKEYKEKIEKSANEYVESHADFVDWLNDNYKADDIWEMSENDRIAVEEEYIEVCHCSAEEEVNEYWKPYEVEV